MHTATYSPEDDKIRLYFSSRIPRDEWDRLRAMGYAWTMKQSEAGGCDMVAVWSPAREDAALALAGEIDDEDQPMAERAAQRAARFSGYLESREEEAEDHASKAEAVGCIIGHQSRARAERLEAKAEREKEKAATQWAKAEYWQRRTASVIRHALHKMDPGLRHRRIKTLEAEARKIEADNVPSEVFEGVEMVIRFRGEEYVAKGHDCVGIFGQGRGKHARSYKKADGPTPHGLRELEHLRLRIAYEKQMLGEQGGTLAQCAEMVPGGFIGSMQIEKVTKDRAGNVSRLYVRGPHPYKEGVTSLHAISAERLKPGSYRAPTAEEAEAFAVGQKAKKAEKPKAPPLINPTPEEAAKLQAVFNAFEAERYERKKAESYEGNYWQAIQDKAMATECLAVVQDWYSSRSQGEYAPCKTIDIAADWTEATWRNGKAVAFRVRALKPAECYAPWRVLVLTDKPQKPIPVREGSNVHAA